jgi:hypothetical protein
MLFTEVEPPPADAVHRAKLAPGNEQGAAVSWSTPTLIHPAIRGQIIDAIGHRAS